MEMKTLNLIRSMSVKLAVDMLKTGQSALEGAHSFIQKHLVKHSLFASHYARDGVMQR